MITQSICLRYDRPTASFIRDGPITVGYSSWIVISTVDMQALWDQKEVFSNTVGILEDVFKQIKRKKNTNSTSDRPKQVARKKMEVLLKSEENLQKSLRDLTILTLGKESLSSRKKRAVVSAIISLIGEAIRAGITINSGKQTEKRLNLRLDKSFE